MTSAVPPYQASENPPTGGKQPSDAKPSNSMLWLSIFGPLVTLGIIVFVWWHSAAYDWLGNGDFVFILLGLQGLISVAGMVFFILAIKKRFKVAALVVFIILYPILQIIVQFAIFFAGCVSVVNITGFQIHGPPDDWENRNREVEWIPEPAEPAAHPPSNELPANDTGNDQAP